MSGAVVSARTSIEMRIVFIGGESWLTGIGMIEIDLGRRNPAARRPSCEDFAGDFSMHVREAKFAALIFESQALVIETEEMKDGGVEIVNVNRLLRDVESEIVGAAVTHSAFHAATGQPH